MDVPLTIQEVETYTVIEFRTTSLMDPVVLTAIGETIYPLVDAQDKRRIILDFEQVQYLSSQAIGIVLAMKKRLDKLPKSKLILCGIGPTLMQLIKLTRLDKVLTIKPTQMEAVKVL